MGLKYAGTGDEKAKETIIKELCKLKEMKTIGVEHINDLAFKNYLLPYNYYKLVSVYLLSLGLVMSGTCDV
jgi:hypothetical protein